MSLLDSSRRRWLQQEQERHKALARAAATAASLLAAVHYSRALAYRCGWTPWQLLVQGVRQQAAEADDLRARLLMRRALDAWQQRRLAAAWLLVARDACAAAGARRCRQQALQRRALAALQQHALWARSLPHLHAARLAAAAWRRWRALGAAARRHAQQQAAAAAAHHARRLCRRALAAWQRGAVKQKRERLAAQRLEAKWSSVQGMLAEARKQRQRQRQQQQAAGEEEEQGGGSGWSSAENSLDPNSFNVDALFR